MGGGASKAAAEAEAEALREAERRARRPKVCTTGELKWALAGKEPEIELMAGSKFVLQTKAAVERAKAEPARADAEASAALAVYRGATEGKRARVTWVPFPGIDRF